MSNQSPKGDDLSPSLPRSTLAKRRFCACSGGLILLGCGLLLAAQALDRSSAPDELMVGLMFGVFFGQPSAAAAWAALGDGRWWPRLLITLPWTSAVVLCFIAGFNEADRLEVIVIFALPILFQYGVTQLALWGLRWWVEVSLQQPESHSRGIPRQRQFGLGQLMMLTFAVGVLLGVGRLIITSPYVREITEPGVLIFFALAVAAMLLTLPVMLAAMLVARSLLATTIALLLAVVTTAVEVQLLKFMPSVGATLWNIVSLNTFTLGWVLLFAAVARWSGYRLCSHRVDSNASAPATV